MGVNVGTIDLGLDINKTSFNRQLSGIAGGAEKGVAKAFSGMGKAIGITLGVAAVKSFTKSCLELGSDLTEVQNVVDTVFPSLNNQINNFAKNAMEKFGLSETVAKKYTGTLGAMSKAMGFSEMQAMSMAENVTGLAGDVASFYNMNSDEAYTKLKSIWTGETETLKDLGVLMTQTNLDQYAMNNGFGRTTSAMDEQTKTMLRYQYVTSALSAAQGDFAKTSDTWANQVRILSLRFDSLKATLGQGFINLFTPLIQGLNSLIAHLQGAAEAFRTFTEMITGKSVETSVGNISVNALGATENILGMGDAATDAAKQAKKAIAPFDELNQVSENTTASSGAGSGGIGTDQPSNTAPNSSPMFPSVSESIKPTLDALERLKDALKPIGGFVFDNIKSFYNDLLVPIGEWTIGKGLPRLLDALTNLLSDVNWPKLSGSISRFNKAIAPLAIAIGQGFLNFVSDLSGVLKPVLAITVDLLADAIDGLSRVLENVDPKQMEDVGYGFGVLGASIAAIKISSKLPGMLISLGMGLRSFIMGLSDLAYLNPVMLPALFDLLGLDDWLDELYNDLPSWARGLWEGFWGAVEGAFKEIFNYDHLFSMVKDMIARFKDAFDGGGDAWYDIGKNILLGIISGFRAIIDIIAEPIADLLSSIHKHLCDLFGIHSPAEKMKPYGKYILQGLIVGFTDTFSEWWASITSWGSKTKEKFNTWASGIWSGIKNEFLSAPSWFKGKFDEAWINVKSAFSGVKNWFQTKYNEITSIFSTIPKWFKDKFTEAWTNVKNVFSTGGKIFDGIKDGIADTFKTVVNGLISGINRIISVPFDKINSMLNSIRSVSVLGIKPFGNLWGENPLGIPKIPPLANGGYVGANQPRLAMIGDNRREGEIVSPESKFQAMLDAATKNGLTEEVLYRVMSRVWRENQMVIEPNEEGIFRIVRRRARAFKVNTGKPAFE